MVCELEIRKQLKRRYNKVRKKILIKAFREILKYNDFLNSITLSFFLFTSVLVKLLFY